MELSDRADRAIERLQHELLLRQSEDGAWRFGVESGPLTDAT
ncbi:hypothetical protein [Gordoniibacillus kamchatkensis]